MPMAANENEANDEYNRLLQGNTHLERLRAFVNGLDEDEAEYILRSLVLDYAPVVLPDALRERIIAVLSAVPEVEIVTGHVENSKGAEGYAYGIVRGYLAEPTDLDAKRDLHVQWLRATEQLPAFVDYLDVLYQYIYLTDAKRSRLERSPNVIFRRERQTSNEG